MRRRFVLLLLVLLSTSACCPMNISFNVYDFDFGIKNTFRTPDPYIELLCTFEQFTNFIQNTQVFSADSLDPNSMLALKNKYNDQFFSKNYLFPIIASCLFGPIEKISVSDDEAKITFKRFLGSLITVWYLNTYFVEVDNAIEIKTFSYDTKEYYVGIPI